MSAMRIGWYLAGAVALAVMVGLPVLVEAVRPLYLLVACLLLPGAGWVRRWGTGDLGDKVALTVAVSMSATILVATAMVATGTWTLLGGLVALAVIAALGFLPLPERHRHRGLRAPRVRGDSRVSR